MLNFGWTVCAVNVKFWLDSLCSKC